jgi:hypothetical protein
LASAKLTVIYMQIVAGLEPENTNIFLQMLAAAAQAGPAEQVVQVREHHKSLVHQLATRIVLSPYHMVLMMLCLGTARAEPEQQQSRLSKRAIAKHYKIRRWHTQHYRARRTAAAAGSTETTPAA